MAANTKDQRLIHKWWVNLLLALFFLGLAYGFASLAIDSGNLLYYVLCAVFVYWAFSRLIRRARNR